jgi:hypothetical protein
MVELGATNTSFINASGVQVREASDREDFLEDV